MYNNENLVATKAGANFDVRCQVIRDTLCQVMRDTLYQVMRDTFSSDALPDIEIALGWSDKRFALSCTSIYLAYKCVLIEHEQRVSDLLKCHLFES